MPDQTQYVFTYQQTPGSNSSSIVTGRMSSVKLPTGGIYTYNYPTQYLNGGTLVNSGDTWCIDGTSTALQRTTPDQGTWTYTRVFPGPEMDVQGPDSTVTKLIFPGSGPSGNYVYQETVWPSGATNPIAASRNFYNGCVWWTSFCSFVLPITQTGVTKEFNVTMSGGNIATSLMAETDSVFNLSGLPLSAKEYDFGTNTKGSLLRDTEIDTYTAWDRPHMITTKDGAGNVKKQTTYLYDQYGLTASGAPQLGTVTAARGNPTTISYLTHGSSTLSQTLKYYDSGSIYTATDVNGGLTTPTYGACGDSFVTNITLPLSLAESMTWNCDGGVPASVTDENSQLTQFGYSDPFWRIGTVTDPLQNIATYSYTPNSEEVSLPVAGGSSVDISITFDGLGRPIFRQQRQSPSSSNFDSVQYGYGWTPNVGPFATISTPYVAAQGQSGGTTAARIQDDALGRPSTISNGSGGALTYIYIKNDVLETLGPPPTGEHVKSKQLEFDGLGRLTSVCEITGGTSAWPGGNCAQASPQTGYWAQYTYDFYNGSNRVTVAQNAQSSTTQTRLYLSDLLGRSVSETNPETGTTQYVYDTNSGTCASYGYPNSFGDQIAKYDANGNAACAQYDPLHRLASIQYYGTNSTASKHFVYDSDSLNGVSMTNAKGRLAGAYTCKAGASTCVGNLVTDEYFGYSRRGEPTDSYEFTPHSGGYYHISALYWPNGALQNIGNNIANLPAAAYGVDSESRVSTATAEDGWSAPLVSSTSYNTASQVTSVTYGSSDNDTFQFDPNTARMTQYQLNMGTTPLADTGVLTWNANGSLGKLQITDQINSSDTQTCNYGHDDLSRVVSANCGSTWAQTFGFDPFGNVTKSGSMSWMPGYNETTNQYTLAGTSYDRNGDLLNDTYRAYGWDADGNLISASGASAIYDALDRMVEADVSSGDFEYVFGAGGQQPVVEMAGQNLVTSYFPLPGGGFAIYNGSGLEQYNHPDWLGSSRLITTPSRTLVNDTAFAPYGEGYADMGNGWDQFTAAGNEWMVWGANNSGLADFLYRKYSSTQGRWISPDPAGLAAANPADPQSWNRYSYVRNSPLNHVDPSGLDGCDWGNPITCIVTFGNGPSSGGISFSGGGPVVFGPFGGGGGNGICLAYCSGRNIVTALYHPPGGASQVNIPGPSYRVMSNDWLPSGYAPASFPPGSIAYNTFGPPSANLWRSANGTMERLTGAYAAGFTLGFGAAAVSTLPAMDVAVGLSEGNLHFAFGADGAWAHAIGEEGEIFVTRGLAKSFANNAFQFSLPVLNPSAVIPAAGVAAYNCFTAVCSGFFRGWIP